ncbi:hypothetical protein SKAU_G00029760 [Synaphobranchus kaupii]|uniref:Ankyrin-2 n=1 Tax=Synaphobranchus kaupii TaxID=118154 RepID=A0A9Q1JDZ5_SYNKA|nr:hypothetical protein SKAU_G00029760 [Synaphobranchus kaupii]
MSWKTPSESGLDSPESQKTASESGPVSPERMSRKTPSESGLDSPESQKTASESGPVSPERMSWKTPSESGLDSPESQKTSSESGPVSPDLIGPLRTPLVSGPVFPELNKSQKTPSESSPVSPEFRETPSESRMTIPAPVRFSLPTSVTSFSTHRVVKPILHGSFFPVSPKSPVSNKKQVEPSPASPTSDRTELQSPEPLNVLLGLLSEFDETAHVLPLLHTPHSAGMGQTTQNINCIPSEKTPSEVSEMSPGFIKSATVSIVSEEGKFTPTSHMSQESGSKEASMPEESLSTSPDIAEICPVKKTPPESKDLTPKDLQSVAPGEPCKSSFGSTMSYSPAMQSSYPDTSEVKHILGAWDTEATEKSDSQYRLKDKDSASLRKEYALSQEEVKIGSDSAVTCPVLKPKATHVCEDSDAEYFDCSQGLSDFSETETEEVKIAPSMTFPSEVPSSQHSPHFKHADGVPGFSTFTLKLRDDRGRLPSTRSEEYTGSPVIFEPDEVVWDGLEEEAQPSCGGAVSIVESLEELPSREVAKYEDDEDSLGMEIAEELGLLSDSSEEEVLTTRVVRRRVIIQADEMPEIPPQTVTEEQYIDEHGNMVVKKITRKIIRKYMSPDGVEQEEVMMEGSHQELVSVEEGDGYSKVVKRTVLRSEGDRTEMTFSEPLPVGEATASEFEAEPVQGRKVSKPPTFLRPKTTSNRTQMHKTRTQKRTVVRDVQGKQVHLELFEDVPEALRPDDLQQHLQRLLHRYCAEEEEEQEEEEGRTE